MTCSSSRNQKKLGISTRQTACVLGSMEDHDAKTRKRGRGEGQDGVPQSGQRDAEGTERYDLCPSDDSGALNKCFRAIPGVLDAVCVYVGGKAPWPTYECIHDYTEG